MAADRAPALCDLLLAAAFSDAHLDDREADRVQELLAYMLDGQVPADLEARIDAFDPRAFDLARTAAVFRGDAQADREHLLSLVAAVHEADETLDLAEDEFLRDLARALALPASALGGLTVKVEVEELKTRFRRISTPPPPPPPAKPKA
ncbi:MAG: TerB family tellurite resistance protein [Kofleriaceae bacterium]|nr:TerB family tellurite resistance protein [Kofleriaceae bacterium]MCL4225912.1 TerB family tellurite resistance protein [Myxococcales bacterium]